MAFSEKLSFLRWCNEKVSRCSRLKCCSTLFQEIKANLIYWTVIALHSITMFRLWMRTEKPLRIDSLLRFFFVLLKAIKIDFLGCFLEEHIEWRRKCTAEVSLMLPRLTWPTCIKHASLGACIYRCIYITVKELCAPGSKVNKTFPFCWFP